MTKRRKPRIARKEDSLRLRLTATEKELWTQVAKSAGRDLSNWLRYVANEAARSSRGIT